MELTDAQQQLVFQWLETHMPIAACEVCHVNAGWEVAANLYQLPTYKSPAFGKFSVAPLVAVSCKNCKHMRLFNAIQIGIITPDRAGGPIDGK